MRHRDFIKFIDRDGDYSHYVSKKVGSTIYFGVKPTGKTTKELVRRVLQSKNPKIGPGIYRELENQLINMTFLCPCVLVEE